LAGYAINVWLFGANGYALFCASVGLHALCAGLFALALFLFVPFLYAFLGGLCLGLYPFMGHFVGRVCMQQYSFVFLCLAGTMFVLKRYLEVQKVRWLMLSVGLFGVSTFFHETALIFPAWLCLMVPFYLEPESFVPSFSAIGRSISISMPYVFMVFCNLGLRLWAYPFVINTEYMVFEPSQLLIYLQHRFFDFVTLAIDTAGITFIPSGYMPVKLLLLMLMTLYCFVLWWQSSKKKEMLLILIGFVAFAWPSVFITHQVRYLYTAIAFFIAAIMVGLAFLQGSRRFKLCMHSLPILLIVSGGLYGFQVTKSRSLKSIIIDESYKKLAVMPELKERSICFVGVPFEWFPVSGGAQAIWMHQDGPEFPIYHDRFFEVHMMQQRSPLQEQMIPRGDFFDVSVKNNVVHMESLDPKQAWFRLETSFGKIFSSTMGSVDVINASGRKGFEVSVAIDERWMQTDPVFVTWDYLHGQFKVISL
jgi:hypothetical protein